MEWAAAVTALVAVFTFLLRLREKRRHVQVTLAYGITLASEGPLLVLTAANPGSRPVTVGQAGLALPGGLTAIGPSFGGSVRLPHTLQEGQSCVTYKELRPLAAQLKAAGYQGRVKVAAFYRDQVGATYRSNRVKVDLEEWS